MQKRRKLKPDKFSIIGILIFVGFLLFYFSLQQADPITEEVSFDKFKTFINEGKVEQVQETPTEYKFKVGKQVYKTGKWKDEGLTKALEEKGVKFSSEIPIKTNPIWGVILSFLPFIIFIGFISYLSKRALGSSNALSFGKTTAKIYVKAQTGKTFKDVAGQDEAKESLSEIVDFLNNPKRYEEIGAICPKGVLLIGPPGTGKTLLAKAVAGEGKAPFFSISGSEFVEMFAGLGATKVRDLFKQAKEKAPCIVFIDEIDTIGKRRDASVYSNDEREQTLNQLLNEMDGFDGNSGVVILAATNRPEVLDLALTRPGRFDRQVRVELPDLKGREAILKLHAKKIKIEDNVNFEHIAKMTAGASGATLANIINESALTAVRNRREKVSENDIIESVEVVIAGHKKKNMIISDKEKKIIAYHEVGHALVAALQKGTAPVTKITIIPRTSGALGYTMQVEEEEKFLRSYEDLYQELMILTGGRCAEELVFNIKTTGAANDIERATKIARAIVTRFGMTEEFDFVALETQTNVYLGGDSQLSAAPQTAAQIDTKLRAIIAKAHKDAFEILRTHEKQLHDIAEYLLQRETITGEEFMDLLKRSNEFHSLDEEKNNNLENEAN